jgi:hypothetical protein
MHVHVVAILRILYWINLFSPWYSWKIAELALNNNHSLTQFIFKKTLLRERKKGLVFLAFITWKICLFLNSVILKHYGNDKIVKLTPWNNLRVKSNFGKIGMICSTGILWADINCHKKYCSNVSHSRLASVKHVKFQTLAFNTHLI